MDVRTSHLRYLTLAAACHIVLTIAIFLIGHFQLLPGTFDQNGVGLTFAIDGGSYQELASQMVTGWQEHGFIVWQRTKVPLHCRLYSLAFATFGRFLGHNILAAEPLNLFYYLGILTCVYLLGREVFDRRTGLLAASMVGVWPSFLLHSTQFIRDPLTILCFLALMLVLILLLRRDFGWRRTLTAAIGGVTLVTLLWVGRGNMWNIVLVAIALTLLMLAFRMVRENRLIAGNLAVMLLILVAALFVPTRFESTALARRPSVTPLAIPSADPPVRRTRDSIWTAVLRQIVERRDGFRSYRSEASNIDVDVTFRSAGDILRFVPRAAVIGFFAPFPRMWVQHGTFGLATRLLSGAETLVMYVVYLAVAYCLWRERRNTQMWLLFLVAAVGLIALGLVVVNAGALYRIRYVFWIMLIVIGSHRFTRMHADYLTTSRTKSTKSRTSSSVVSNDAISRTSEISSSQT